MIFFSGEPLSSVTNHVCQAIPPESRSPGYEKWTGVVRNYSSDTAVAIISCQKKHYITETSVSLFLSHLSVVMRKPAFCICENKDADQLCGDRTADQRLCFRYIDTIPLLPKSEISSL